MSTGEDVPQAMSAYSATVVLDHELLELVSSLVCLLRGGRIDFINQAGVRILGLKSADQAAGHPFDEFIEADYRFLLEAGWDLLAEEDFLPLKLQRVDGSMFEAEVRVRRVASDDVFLIEGRDISKALRSAEALREREERLQGILSSVAEGIVTIGEHGLIESANPAAERMFGFPPGKLAGIAIGALMPEELRERHERMFTRLLAGPSSALLGRAVDTMGRRHDGTLFPMEISISELRHGKARLFTGIVRDISERKENEDRIKRLAHHDNLTGLPNRNLLNDRINHALARVRRHGGRMAVLYVDLDKFKPINDTLGHKAGDMVLKEVARRLKDCIRGSDTVARVGGDEFVVVIEEIARPAEAALVSRKIIDILAKPVDVDGTPCTVGASIGVAVFPDDGYTMDEVCKAADIAMYRVKRSGRNGFCFFGETPTEEEISAE
ncbi:MAG: diguanylate cyclase domain-containing protein [Actinomycetota bacterium]